MKFVEMKRIYLSYSTCQLQRIQQMVFILLFGFVFVACNSQKDTAIDSVAEVRNSVSAPALRPVETVVTSQTDDMATPEPVERVQFSGVTFTYPPALVDAVQTERVSVSGTSVDAAGIPQAVLFTFLRESNAPAPTLQIQAVREKNGLYYAALPELQRQQVAEVATQLQAEQSIGIYVQSIRFVNGQGMRSIIDVENDPVYSFQGFTNDNRYLVEFTFPVAGDSTAAHQHTPNLAQIDAIIESLFVDSAAEALNVVNCVDDAEFVANVTIPDGTEIAPGETFVKTWRMRNTGTCTWTNNYSWTFKGGDVLTLLDATGIDLVSPGEEVDISVTLIAPESPGAYAGQWQLSGSNQFEGFGSEVYYLIVVPEA